MNVLSVLTPYDPLFNEDSMAIKIGGDSRRAICFYKSAGAGNCDGVYSIWGKKGDAPWMRVGNTINIAGSVRGHALPNMECINGFDKLYVSVDALVNADQWFLVNGGNMGYI